MLRSTVKHTALLVPSLMKIMSCKPIQLKCVISYRNNTKKHLVTLIQALKKITDCENINSEALDDIQFNEQDIIWAINQIPLHSAPGPDKIPSILLKECKKELAPALLTIWRKSLNTGQIPDILKKRSIVPIHKKI